jgi:D-tyrosyl-tRNA(Tyr) deacylase
MRVVVQRVKEAKIEVDRQIVGSIGKGLLVYLGVGKADSEKDVEFIADKLVNLRIFADENDKMNLSVLDVQGVILLVSQFTLYGDCRKGRRPGFDLASEPQTAERLYEKTIDAIRQKGALIETGVFAAHMDVTSINDGPVTFLLDSKKTF